MQCWQDIAQFQQFLQCMLSQMGPVPLQGVTDGSSAKAGYIGEFLTATITTPWSIASGANQTQNVSTIVMPPGDWDLSCRLAVTFPFTNTLFNCTPLPAGMTGDLSGAVGATGMGAISPIQETYLIMPGMTSRLSNTVPTLIPMSIIIDNATGAAVSGNTLMTVSGRRAR
jgi:hypothetical protein